MLTSKGTKTLPSISSLKGIPLPGEYKVLPWLKGAKRVVAYGKNDSAVIVAAGFGWLRWYKSDGTLLGEHKSGGGAHVLELSDVDGNGVPEVILGRGMDREDRGAKLSLEILHLGVSARVEEIALPPTTRNQVVAVAAIPGGQGLWVASFVSKYMVTVGRYSRNEEGKWTIAESYGEHRVVSDLQVLPTGEPVIARMYGETADAPGGVYVLKSKTKMKAIPSFRGVRAILALSSSTGLVMADGWHKEYRRKAKGRLTFMQKKNEKWNRVSGVQVESNFGYAQLRLGDVHSMQGDEIVASGNGEVAVMLLGDSRRVFILRDSQAVDAFPIQLQGDPRNEIVIVGPKPAMWIPR